MSRGLRALAAVALVVALVVLGFHALTRDDPAPSGDGSAAPRSRATVPPAPADAPPEGLYVVSTVTTNGCLLYTSPSPRDGLLSRMPSSA